MAPARYRPEHLEAFALQLLTAAGMPELSAALVARALMWAEARGVGTHGLLRLPTYLERLATGEIAAAAVPSIERQIGATTLIDGHRAAGMVALEPAIGTALAASRQHGIGLTLVHDTTHTGAIGYYAMRLAEQGAIGLVTAAGTPLMAYHGTRVPSLGTAPIAIAVPRKGHEPMLLDMATSVVSNGRLKQAAMQGEAIPTDWALTRDGQRTTDPKQASLILPLGGPKGSGLALMFECLAGVLAGAPVLSRMLAPGAKQWHVHNATVIAIDVAAFRAPDDYAADVDALARTIKALPRLDGVDEIRLPGERSQAKAAGSRKLGIALSEALVTELARLADQYRTPMPGAVT